jgi:demethylmenaquinone methyltransferase/2-methoxy-6-polyprenyl-1,4-benzoquinol methylase
MADHPAGPGETLQGEAKRRYVADLFTRIAPRYDTMNTVMTGGMHHRWRKLAAAVATQGLEGVALDMAAGTGDLAFALAEERGIRGVVGLDLLPEMVARAHSKALARGVEGFLHPGQRTGSPDKPVPPEHVPDVRGKIQFAVGDALSLPFPDNTFACATSAWGLRNMPDLRRSLEEMVRVVRPGGRVVSLESMPLEGGPFRPMFRLFFHHIVPLMGQLIARDRAAYTYLPRSVDMFLSINDLARNFEEVGLADVGYKRMGLGAVAVHWGTKT